MNKSELKNHLDHAMTDIAPNEADFALIEKEAEERRIAKTKAKKSRLKYYIAAAAALVLTLSATTAGLLGYFDVFKKPSKIENLEAIVFSVTAEKESKAGITADSGFTITSDRDVAAEDLKPYIKMTPEGEFTLKKQSAGIYYLSAGVMEAGQLVTISLVDNQDRPLKSAAFQTEQEFGVETAYPKNNYSYADVKTGIELKFTYPDVEISEYKKYFSISPEVEGTFEKHGATLSFVPEEPLEEGKRYIVTLKAGLTSPTGGTLKEAYVLTFKTQQDTKAYGITGRATETFLPDDNPLIEVYAKDGYLDNDYSAVVYRFPDAESYKKMLTEQLLKQTINQYGSNDPEDDLPISGLKSFLSYTGQFVNIRKQSGYDNSRNYGYAVLPDVMPEGWYLVKFSTTAPDGTQMDFQKLLQISPLSVYAVSAVDNISLWVNDTATGKAVSNAFVSIEGFDMSGRTGADGVLTLEKNDKAVSLLEEDYVNQTYLLTIKSGNMQYLDVSSFSTESYYYNNGQQIQNAFYTAIYSDRAAYLPTDTVNVWGVIRPRDGKTKVPDNLTVQMGTHEVPVTVEKDGSFTVKIELEDALSGYNSLSLCQNDESIVSRGIQVLDYTKPSYVIEATTDSWFYTDIDQPIKLQVQSNFYDGTPVEGLSIAARYNGSNGTEETYEAVLDDNGSAAMELKIYDNPNYWYPVYTSIQVNSTNAENTYSYSGNKEVYLFLRDIMLEYDVDVDEARKSVINITTNKIDTSRLSQEEPGVWTPDLIRGEAADVDIILTATRHYYEKVDMGSYYDYVRKVNQQRYQYVHREDQPLVYKVKTTGGKLVFSDLPALQGNDYYDITYQYNDSKGKPVTVNGGVYSDMYQETRKGKSFTFYPENGIASMLKDPPQQLQLKENGLKVTSTGSDRILTVKNKSSIFSASVSAGTDVTLQNEESMIPNCNIGGAYFDGRYVYSIDGFEWYYDSSERQMDIKIETDKTVYNTKDKSKVMITATIDGKAVSNASLLVSVADEAALAVAENDFTLLSTLYRSSYNIYTTSYTSYIYHDMNQVQYYDDGGKGGEGGSEGVRKDFIDTALFTTLKTDANGKATTEISLPDNLTEWRITVMGFDQAMNAGQGETGIKVTRDFFLSPIISKQFIAGDDVVFSVRSYGEKAKDNTVDYTVTLNGDKTDEKKLQGSAKSNTVVSFGQLPVGSYTVTILGALGSDSDGVEMPFTVVGSGVEMLQTSTIDLKDGFDINPTRYPVTVSFYNSDYDFFNQLLNMLISAPALRADEKVAAVFSTDLVAKMTGIANETYQQQRSQFFETGAFSPYNASESDPILTARLAAAAPQYFSQNMVDFFEYSLNNKKYSREQIAACYMGLAALKQPVLNDLRYLVNQSKLTMSEQLYFIAGLALIGDSDGAKAAYEAYIQPNLMISEDADGYTLYAFNNNMEDSAYQKTALSLMTAAAIGNPQAEGLARTLLSVNSKEDLYYSEFMTYLSYYKVSDNQSEAAFSYQKNGKTEKVTLNSRDPVVLTFDKAGYQNANFKVLSGNIGASAYYYGTPKLTGDTESMSIVKTINLMQEGLQTGGMIEIVLAPNAIKYNEKQEYYQINDYLPSGFRFLYVSSDYNSYIHLISQEGQKLSFSYSMPPYASSGYIRYYARAILPGTFTVDSTYLTGPRAQMAMSPKTTITIDEK